MESFEVVVIGGGVGGYVAAIEAAKCGAHVALVEQDALGGTCLNRGCIPTKTLMHTTDLLEQVRKAQSCGLHVDGAHVDLAELFARKDEVVGQLVDGVATLLKGNGVEVFHGHGTLEVADGGTPHLVHISALEEDSTCLSADKVIIATGSTPSRPPIPGLDLPGVVTSDDLLSSPVEYKSLIIIGGGVIGIEMASIYSELGCKVTVIEALSRILSTMDREISQSVTMSAKKRGIEIYTSARVASLEQADDLVKVSFTYKDEPHEVKAQGVLAAMGRRPDTAEAFLGTMPQMERGFIVVDDRYETSIPGVFAIGDCIGGIMLAHKAEAEGICAARIACGLEPDVDTRCVPACVYMSPEIATVGLTEDEAKESGIETYVGKYLMGGNGKTIIAQGGRGFIKLVFNAADDSLIGATLLCERATDMISELVTAMNLGLTQQQLASTMRPHPTFSEGISEAVHAAAGRAIHVMPPRKR